MSDRGMSEQERKAIIALQRAAKIWPDSLWLFSADGILHVMRKTDEGVHAVTNNGGMDPDFMIGVTIDIENDGGDW